MSGVETEEYKWKEKVMILRGTKKIETEWKREKGGLVFRKVQGLSLNILQFNMNQKKFLVLLCDDDFRLDISGIIANSNILFWFILIIVVPTHHNHQQ